MAELALQGKFIEIPETLFYRRMHEQASSWNRSNQAVQQHFWGGVKSAFVMPTLNKEYSLWRAIDGAPVGFHEKLRMKKYIFRRILWSRKAISREILHAVARRLAINM